MISLVAPPNIGSANMIIDTASPNATLNQPNI